MDAAHISDTRAKSYADTVQIINITSHKTLLLAMVKLERSKSCNEPSPIKLMV